MEKSDFLVNFAEQFEMSDPSKMTFSTPFKELEEWSSLVHLSLIMMLDETYGASIDEDDFDKLVTVEDVYNFINKK